MRKREQMIQLPLAAVYDMARLLALLEAETLDGETRKICDRLADVIHEKVERMTRHEAFSIYKTSEPGSAKREEARQLYVERAEFPWPYRSEKETRS